MFNVRSIIVASLLFSAIVMLYLTLVVWGRRKTVGLSATYFALSMILMSIYTLAYAMELSSNTLQEIMVWIKFEYIGIPTLPPTWLLFAICITGQEAWITRRRVFFLYIIPAVTIIANYTNAYHYLYYATTRLNTSGPFPTLAITMGPFYWLHLIFSNACLIAITFLILRMLIRSAPSFRKQAVIFFIGSLMPWVGYGVYFSGHSPYGLDLIPIAMVIAGPLFLLGIFQFRIFDVVPLARDLVFDWISDGVLVIDREERIIDINRAGRVMLPDLDRLVVGTPAREALSRYPELIRLVESEPQEAPEIRVARDGENRYLQTRIAPVQDRRGKTVGKTIAFHDNTRERLLMDQLKRLARLDGLTGIYNYRHFSELANIEIDRARRYSKVFSLIFLDLDHFKQVNDRFGHAAGDATLKAVVRRCHRAIRRSDIIARLGGEEFVVFCPETVPQKAGQIAERLCRAVGSKPILFEGAPISVTVSIGVTGLDEPSEVFLDELLRDADQALYQAKKKGRNQVCVHSIKAAS